MTEQTPQQRLRETVQGIGAPPEAEGVIAPESPVIDAPTWGMDDPMGEVQWGWEDDLAVGMDALDFEEPEPGIGGRIVQRFMGTDVDDPLEIPRIAGVLSGGFGLGILGSRTPTAPGPAGLVMNPITGAVIGGATGTAIGAVSPETGLSLGEAFGVLEPGTRARLGLTPEELRMVAEGEVLLDLATAGGFFGLRSLGRGAINVFTGTGRREARELSEAAARYDINLMPVQVGNRTIARGYVSVLGRFPFIGSAITRRGREAEEAARTAFQDLPERIAPVVRSTDLGPIIYNDAQTLFREFGQQMGRRYEEVFTRADDVGVSVVPRITIEKGNEILQKLSARAPRTVTGELTPEGKALQPVVDFIQNNIVPLASQTDAGRITAKQTLRQMDTIINNIDQEIAALEPSARKFASALMNQLRQSAQADMLMNVRGAQADEIVSALRGLDTEFSHAMSEIFTTSTAKRFGTVQRRGLTGLARDDATRTPVDQLARVVTNLQSPQAMEELSRLVTPATFQRISARVFDDALELASRNQSGAAGFDVDVFARALGIDAPGSAKHATVARMLDLSDAPFKMADLDELVRVGRAIADMEIPNVSTFIARRATIGGLQGLINGVVPGLALTGAAGGAASYGGSLVGMAVFVGGGKLVSAMISNPTAARSFVKVLDKEATMLVRRQAWLDATRGGLAVLRDEGTISTDQFFTLMDAARDTMNAFMDELTAMESRQ